VSLDLQLVISLLAAFGLGSVVTAVIQDRLNARRDRAKRNFEEKKEAFIGLLKAYHVAAVEPSERSSKEFGYWQSRCELVASEKVRKAVQRMIETSGNENAERPKAYLEFLDSLREDLGIIEKR